MALTLLHRDRTKDKFGRNLHFMCRDNLTNSHEGFLEHQFDAIGTGRPTDIEQLRSHLESSPLLILLLDGVDYILDLLTPGAGGVFATVVGFGCCQNVCLLATSRIHPEIPDFRRLEVPTLSVHDAQGAIYGICHITRSPVIDNLIARLGFIHFQSICSPPPYVRTIGMNLSSERP